MLRCFGLLVLPQESLRPHAYLSMRQAGSNILAFQYCIDFELIFYLFESKLSDYITIWLDRKFLMQVLEARNKLPGTKRPPLLIKLSPDLTKEDKSDIAKVLSRPGV